MERLKIDRDEKGKFKRVYIEHPVLTPKPLFKLQQTLLDTVDFKCAPVNDLHLTLFHYGKPENLYSEVNHTNPHLDLNSFMERFIDLLEHNAQLKSDNILVLGNSLDIFGDATKPALVLRLSMLEELLRLRRGVTNRFSNFLSRCGVVDIDSFMKGSPNLKYQLDYNPHLTLGFPKRAFQLPKINVTPVEVILGSPQLANVRFGKQS